jgi:flap endonuclease-1
MGIKHLNKFFKENASESTKLISLSELSGKKIAVDISIYMYKYASDDTLIENIYLMLSVFRHYNVIPIFVFDGKPPTEKNELLKKRRHDRKRAEEEYNLLKNKLINNDDLDDIERQDLINNMDMLKRSFVNINKNDIKNVKELIISYGATYYDAPGEADELCAILSIRGKVWACLSEDMDMFVYGCPRVIRYISLLNHTAVIYDMKGILENLGVTQKELREICVLSGTDYNNLNDNVKNSPTLYTTLKYFKKFHKDKNNTNDFYDWLLENTNYIRDSENLKKIYNIFDLSKGHDNIKVFENVKIINGTIMKDNIKQILKTDGFIFLESNQF